MISSLGSYGGSNVAQMRQKLFAKADTNGDSSLSKDELLASLKSMSGDGNADKDASALVDKLFSDMDSDSSGSISQSEFSSFKPKFAANTASTLLSAQQQSQQRPTADQMLAETDSNGDGTITKDELSALISSRSQDGQGGPSVDEMFSTMDENGDGSVSKEELSSFASKAPSGPPPGPPPGGAQGPQGAGGASASSQTSSSSSTDPLDTNKDGVVSLAERMAAATQSGASSTTGNLASSTLSALLQSVNEVAA